MSETDPMLLVLHYSAHSTSDNMRHVENSTCAERSEHAPAAVNLPEAAPAPSDIERLVPALPGACPAASLQGEHSITISPEGFRHRSHRGESLVAWHVFNEITADSDALYFFTEVLTTGRTAVYGIPRRAFATPQAADAFLSQALAYWTNRSVIPPAGPAGSGAPYERWS